MFEQHLIVFAFIGIIGLAIIILGFKFSEKNRKVVETTGAIIFHVGVFGVLYYKVELSLFISLVALVISLFILIDPLKIGDHVNTKIYRLFGYITLFASFAFSLDFFSGFPVWLWAIPLMIYLSPYLISPLRKRMALILTVSWLVVFSYVGLIGYVIFAKYNPQMNTSLIKKFLPQLRLPVSKDTAYSEEHFTYRPTTHEPENNTGDSPAPGETKEKTIVKDHATPQVKVTDITQPQSYKTPSRPITKNDADDKLPSGPYLKSLKEADNTFMRLQNDYNALKSKYDGLVQANQKLEQEIEKLRNKEKNQNAIHAETF